MTIEFKLPSIADGVDDGEVSELYVSEGDTIQKDDPVLELEVSKGQVPVPCDVAGKVVKIHVSEGDTVPIGAVLLTIEESSEAGGGSEPAAQPPAEEAKQPEPEPEPTPEPEPEPQAQAPEPPPLKQPVTGPPEPAPKPSAAPTPKPIQPTSPAAESDTLVAAGPAIRRFAREVGVDLANIEGTGPGGRIVRDDILRAVRSGGNANQAAAAPAASSTTKDAPTPAPASGDQDKWGPVRIEKLPRIRKAIAEKMHESWSTAPRVTNFDDADVTELELIRKSSKEDYARKGIKLTSMPFVIKAVAMALKQNPVINASIDMENNQIIYKDYVNVGIAVDTERGLVVPSLRDADNKSIKEIARELMDMAANVRDGKFALDDLSGSTFTISNLGAIGGTYSTPIINVPEVAILLLGRSRKLPVVIDDDVVIRTMMPLSLSYDHRLVDGGAAGRFLNNVIELLATPSRLLLAP